MKYRMELLRINDKLDKISRRLNEIESKIDSLVMIHSNVNLKINPNILCLPQHLQQTVLALNQIGRGTATDVAQRTGKARALESSYLNQLVIEQYIIKFRSKDASVGRKQVIFALRNAL